MKNERFDNFHAGAVWHCNVCNNPTMSGPVVEDKDKICPQCAEENEDCSAWIK